MGDFNCDPKNRQVTSYNKRKLEFIINIEDLDLYNNTKLCNDINTIILYNTWEKYSANHVILSESRIDMI